jgi:hypothetical protein
MSVNENTKEMEQKIRNWLLEEGFKITLLSDEHACFNIVAEDTDGRKVNVAQPIKKKDKITIATGAILSKELQQKVITLEAEERNRLLWTLRLGLLNRGVGFSGIEVPLESVEVSTIIYYDGLTKDNFMQRLFEVRKSLLFIFWMVERMLGEPEPTIEPYYIE